MIPEQLQKMGMLETNKTQTSPTATIKRKSTDFTKLGSLNKFGTVGFSTYRETATPRKKTAKNKDDDDAMDSDPDDNDDRLSKDADGNDAQNDSLLTPEDARKQGELAEGVRKIKVRHSYRSLYDYYLPSKQLKRAHSGEAVNDTRKSPYIGGAASPTIGTPQSGNSTVATAGTPPEQSTSEGQGMGVASPHKKQRASMDALDATLLPPWGAVDITTSTANGPVQSTTSGSAPSVISAATAEHIPQLPTVQDEDEEL